MRPRLLDRSSPAPPPPIAARSQRPPSRGEETHVSDDPTSVGVAVVLFVFALVLFSGVPTGPLVTFGEAHAALASFPYSYSTPNIPAGVGAQGRQGTIPGLPIGPPPGLVVGPVGHLGPVADPSSGYFHRSAVRAGYQIFNGTLHPNAASPSVDAHVSARNATYGWWANGTTNAQGFVNLSVWAGWYDVVVSQPSGVVNLAEQENIMASQTLSRWLLPTSTATALVHNCGASQSTCTRTVYAHVFGLWRQQALPQWTVLLLNASNGNAQLASAVTGSNGSAIFTQVNSVYSYSFATNGYSQAYTGVVWSTSNDSAGPLAGSSLVDATMHASRYTIYSGSVTGTSPPVAGFSWTLAANTVLTGGTLFLGQHWWPAGFTLKLNGVRLYWDADQGNVASAGIALANCTIIELDQASPFSVTGAAFLYLNESTLLGSAIPALFGAQLNLQVTSATSSIVDVTNTTLAGPGIVSGAWTNDRWEWNASTSRNSSATVVFGTLSVTSSAVWGLNSLGSIGSYAENWAHVQFVSSRAGLTDSLAQSSYGGWLNLTNSTSANSTMFADANATFLWGDNLTVNYSVGANTSGFSGPRGTFDRTRISFGLATGQNYTALYLTLRPGGTNAGPFPGFAGAYRVPNDWNFSQSDLEYTAFPMVNVTFNAAAPVRLCWFDDDYNATRPIGQFLANYTSGGRLFLKAGGMGIWSNAGSMFINYSTLNNSMGWLAAGSGAMTHDLWPVFVVYNGYADGIQMFYQPDPMHPSVNKTYDFENDTWSRLLFNRTVWGDVTTGIQWFAPEAQEIVQDTNNYGAPRNGRLVFVHNTVDPIMVGAGQVAPMTMEVAKTNVNYVIADNLFRNDPSYVTVQGALIVHPYATDIQATSGNVTITHNWFLNLNNESVAVASTNLQGEPPSAGGSQPHIVMRSNHLVFAPAEGQPFVDPSGPYQPSESPSAPLDFLGIPAQATVSFELPMGLNVTGPSNDGSPLVFNTTTLQYDPRYGIYPSILWTHAWSWGVAPSVNTSSGSPVVSYVGLGGLQPNFVWAGHAYQLAVEPSTMRIAADAGSAPPVTLQFSEAAGLTYTVTAWNSVTGYLVANEQLSANATGVLPFTFAPGTMPLNVTVQVSNGTLATGPGGSASGGALSSLWAFALLAIAVPAIAVVLVVGYRGSQEER